MIHTIIPWLSLGLVTAGLALALRSDLPFIRRPVRRVTAQVIRHDRRFDDGTRVYSPVFRFHDECARPVEVRDALYTPFETPVVGEMIEIVYPAGMPEKARIPYPVFRAMVYAVLGYGFVMLGAKVTGLGW